MPTEELSTMELLEQREKEVYEELGRLDMNDPKRGPLLNEAKTLAGIRVAYEETEQTRLNNNAKNDIEEEKLVIESEKLKNDKARMKLDFGKAAMYLFGGFASGLSSYMLEGWFQEYKPLKRFQERVHDLVIRK